MRERASVTAPIKALLTFWDELYVSHIGARYPFNGGRDSKWVKEWRAVYTDDELKTFMAAFFEIEDDFIQASGYGLGVFRGCLPKVIQFVKRGQLQKTPGVSKQVVEPMKAWLDQKKASSQ